MTPVVDAETVKQGSKAIKSLTEPRAFNNVLTLVALAFAGLLIVWSRQDSQAQTKAFLDALGKNTEAVEKLADKVSTHTAVVEAVRHEVERLRDRAR